MKKQKYIRSKEEEYIFSISKHATRQYKESDPPLIKLARLLKLNDDNKCRIGKTEMKFFNQEIKWSDIFKHFSVQNRSPETHQNRSLKKPSLKKRHSALILVNVLEKYGQLVYGENYPSILTEVPTNLIDQLNKDRAKLKEKYPEHAIQGDIAVKKSKFSETKHNQRQVNPQISLNFNETNNIGLEKEPYKEEYSTNYSESFMSEDFCENQYDINRCYELDIFDIYDNVIEQEVIFELDGEEDIKSNQNNQCQMIAYKNEDGKVDYRIIGQKDTSPWPQNSKINITFECDFINLDHWQQDKNLDLSFIPQQNEISKIDIENEVSSFDQFQFNERTNIMRDNQYNTNNYNHVFNPEMIVEDNQSHLFTEEISLFPSERGPFHQNLGQLSQDLGLFPQSDGNIQNFRTLEDYYYYFKKTRYCEFCYGFLEDQEGEWQSIRHIAEKCECTRTTSAKVPGC